MATNLNEYLRAHKCKGFQPVPQYFPTGDFLTYYFKDTPCHAKRIDELLTVYLGDDTRELVGFKIKGAKHIVTHAGNFGVLINDENIQMGLFFFVGAAATKDVAQLRWYTELGKQAGDIRVDRSLVSC